MLTIGITERKQREQEEMREDILKAAREIMSKDGVDDISIRKIAAMIEYSPAIIYHYFENKDEIIEKLVEEDYGKIIKSLSSLKSSDMTAEDKVRESIRKFITTAVKMGDSYKSMMMNDSPKILAHTSVLQQGSSAKRTAISILCSTIKQFPEINKKDDEQVELISQIIWSTVFGLTLRVIVEHVYDNQQNKLINQVAEFILSALKNIR